MTTSSHDSQARRTPALRRWLGAWFDLLRREPVQIVAYAMIVPALIALALAGDGLPPWRHYGALLALGVLLALNVALAQHRDADVRGSPAIWRFLLLSGALLLATIWLSGGVGFTVYVLFLVVGQITWGLRLPHALPLIAALVAACAAAFGAPHALEALLGIAPGVFFTIVFTHTAVRYAEQTARAEGLLQQLRQAKEELEAAHAREKALAAAEERVRLARDIHDGLGHHLTVLNVQLQAAEKLLARDRDRARQAIVTSREVAQAALDEVRQSVSALRRGPLDDRGLDEALVALVGEFGRRAGMVAELVQRGAPAPLTPAAATTVYRAAQEGLTNARKHGSAQRVTVTLEYAAAGVRLSVQDDGSGSAAGPGGGFGLAALRERAEQLGGTLAAGPCAGGFLLELSLPAARA